MGQKLLWLGVAILLTDRVLLVIPAANLVGAIIIWIGFFLYLFDK